MRTKLVPVDGALKNLINIFKKLAGQIIPVFLTVCMHISKYLTMEIRE